MFLNYKLKMLFLLAFKGQTEKTECISALLSLNPLSFSQAKDGADQDSRKSFPKRGSKAGDITDFPSGADSQLLDTISEEDENHSASSRTPGAKKKGAGSSYQTLPNDEESGPEEADTTTPLLHKEASHSSSQRTGPLPKSGFLAEISLDKKDSSDSGMRSSNSSSDRSLEEAEGDGEKGAAKRSLMELELEGLVKKRGLLPSSLSGLPDATVARMSICSEAPSEASLMASSPEEGWTPSGHGNLNAANDNTAFNDNATNDNASISNRQPESTAPCSTSLSPVIVITPGSTAPPGTTVATIHNQNLRSVSLGEEGESVL